MTFIVAQHVSVRQGKTGLDHRPDLFFVEVAEPSREVAEAYDGIAPHLCVHVHGQPEAYLLGKGRIVRCHCHGERHEGEFIGIAPRDRRLNVVAGKVFTVLESSWVRAYIMRSSLRAKRAIPFLMNFRT